MQIDELDLAGYARYFAIFVIDKHQHGCGQHNGGDDHRGHMRQHVLVLEHAHRRDHDEGKHQRWNKIQLGHQHQADCQPKIQRALAGG